MRSVDWKSLALGVGRLGEYVTLDKTFYSLLFKLQIVAATVIPHVILYLIPRGGLYLKYNNYTMH